MVKADERQTPRGSRLRPFLFFSAWDSGDLDRPFLICTDAGSARRVKITQKPPKPQLGPLFAADGTWVCGKHHASGVRLRLPIAIPLPNSDPQGHGPGIGHKISTQHVTTQGKGRDREYDSKDPSSSTTHPHPSVVLHPLLPWKPRRSSRVIHIPPAIRRRYAANAL